MIPGAENADDDPVHAAFERAWWAEADPDPEVYVHDMNEPAKTVVRVKLLKIRLDLDRKLTRIIAPFQKALREGGSPRAEDFLGDATGSRRDRLIRELLRVEFYWRSR